MITLRDIFTAYAPEYIERHPHLPISHHKAIDAICRCRTGAYGYSVYACQHCGHHHRVNHACGNRHCPQCQHHKAQRWLHNQLQKQLPGPYFLITFTVPEALRPFCRSHPTLAYQTMFKASSEALKRLAKDPRFIGTTLPGFTGILHTWGRQLQYHPHIHYIVPGGGLSDNRDAWLPSRAHFYVPVRALSPIYRAIFAEEMCHAGQREQIAPQVWDTPWNVQVKPLQTVPPPCNTSRRTSSKSPSQSPHRQPHGAHRHLHLPQTRKFPPAHHQPRRPGVIRRFLQHILPAGFMKVRHFGFLHASCPIKTASGLLLPCPPAPSWRGHTPQPIPLRRWPAPTAARNSLSSPGCCPIRWPSGYGMRGGLWAIIRRLHSDLPRHSA